MKVKEITVNYSRTINIGNYESLKIEMGETVTLDAKDIPAVVRNTRFLQLKKEVSTIVKEIKSK